MVKKLLKWKKVAMSLLTSSLLFTSFPINVFSEEVITKNTEEETELIEIENEYDVSENEKAIELWEINEESTEIKSHGYVILTDQHVFISQEITKEGKLYVLLHNDKEKIGWVLNEDIEAIEEKYNMQIDRILLDEVEEELQDENLLDEDYPKEETNEIVDEIEADEPESDTPSLSNYSISNTLNELVVESTTDITYAADVIKPWSINSRPWGTEGFKLVANGSDFLGDTLKIVQEKVTARSTYALLKQGSKEIGWIDVTGIRPHVINSTKDINYTIEVTKPWSINTHPWGTRGFKKVDVANSVGQEFNVRKEAVTSRSTYALLTQEGKDIGWIDKTGIEERKGILSEKTINYTADVVHPWAVHSRPWGTVNSHPVVKAGELVGETVSVSKEKTTSRATYSLVSIGNKEIGWVDKSALDIYNITNRKKVDYHAEVIKPWSINTLPWGTEGYNTVANQASLGEIYKVIEEASTRRSTYLLLEKDNKKVGWIDSTGMKQTYIVLSSRNTSYAADVIKPWSINSEPWGTSGYKQVVPTGHLLGDTVTVSQEKTTSKATYALIHSGSKKIGWVDKTALRTYPILSTRSVNYEVKVTKPWSINSQPWGVEGFKATASGDSLVGQEYKVVKESVTRKSMYMLLEKNGKTIGWIDSTGVENKLKVLSTKSVNYSARVSKPWSINTEPWGTRGSQMVPNYSRYLGERVTVSQEKTTSRATYALIQYQGRQLGWIDKNALETRNLIVIDPGHGGSDPGAHGILNGKRIKEKDLNLSISLRLRERLVAQGYEVVMTRETDKAIDMVDRARMANNLNADIFVSIHHNSMPGNNSGVDGIETIYYSPSSNYPPLINDKMHNDPKRIAESKKLANSVQSSLISSTGARYRRVFGGAYVVVRETTMPAIIPELGFLSNQAELRKVTTSSYQESLIRGLVNGINNYFNN